MKLPAIFWGSPPVGLDLGTRTLKGVQLSRRKGKVRLDRYFYCDLAESSSGYPLKVDFSEALRSELEINAILARDAFLGLTDNEVFSCTLNLPKLPRKQLEQAVTVELAETTSFPPEEIVMDYLIRKEIEPDPGSQEGPTLQIKAYCTKRQQVEQRLSLLKGTGLKAKAMESEMLASIEMLNFNRYLADDQTYVVIDLGESHICSALISEGDLKGVRSEQVGLGEVNRILTSDFGLSFKDAEAAKRGFDFNMGGGSDDSQAMTIELAFSKVFAELKTSFELFSEALGGRKVTQAILVGGGSQVRNLPRVIKMLFGVPAIVANPFRNIEIFHRPELREDSRLALVAPSLGAAVGLALQGVR